MCAHQRTGQCASESKYCDYRLGRSVWSRATGGRAKRKIEGFFAICEQRELNGKQGVIIPAANVRHLSLKSELLQAVKEEKFTIWAVDDVTDALPLLLNLVWDGEGQTTLMQTIQSVSRRRRNRKAVIVSRGHYVG